MRSVLEVKGARQVGKTTTLLHFAKENYENLIYIDLTSVQGKRFIYFAEKEGNMIIFCFKVGNTEFYCVDAGV